MKFKLLPPGRNSHLRLPVEIPEFPMPIFLAVRDKFVYEKNHLTPFFSSKPISPSYLIH